MLALAPPLRAPAQTREQLAQAALAISHLPLLRAHGAPRFIRPPAAADRPRPRRATQQWFALRNFFRRQRALSVRPAPVRRLLQTRQSVRLVRLHPTTDRLIVHSQHRSDRPVTVALRDEEQRRTAWSFLTIQFQVLVAAYRFLLSLAT